MEISPDTPVIPPPNGQQSNFVNPPDWYTWTLGVGVTSMTIMTIAVSIRTYTKVVILREFRHEDFVALLALLGFLAWCVIYIYLASAGITRDLWNIRAIDMPHFLYLLNVFQVLYGPAMLCAKYFILIQLKRIFCPPGMRNSVWWALYALVTATIIYYVSCFFTFLFQCTPRERIWNPAIEGNCINNNGAVLSAGIINLLLDLGILLVPIWAVWHLKMTLKRKMGVVAIFTMGFVTCGFAAAGVAYRVPLMTDPNMTRASAKVGLWTLAELTGTIVIGCMPMMPRFYEIKLAPTLSHISESSLRALTSASRKSHSSLNASTETPGSTSFRPNNSKKDSASGRSMDSESGYNHIELSSPPDKTMV